MRMNGLAVLGGDIVWNEPNSAWQLVGPAYFAAQ